MTTPPSSASSTPCWAKRSKRRHRTSISRPSSAPWSFVFASMGCCGRSCAPIASSPPCWYRASRWCRAWTSPRSGCPRMVVFPCASAGAPSTCGSPPCRRATASGWYCVCSTKTPSASSSSSLAWPSATAPSSASSSESPTALSWWPARPARASPPPCMRRSPRSTRGIATSSRWKTPSNMT